MATRQDLALVFPGQGSQVVGMGRDVYESSPAARAVFDLADSTLGWSVSRLCFDGPDEALRETANAQPAIVTTSIAILAALEERCAARGVELRPAFVAGHSVGQYAAIIASGALDFTAVIRLVAQRGRLMNEAGAQAPGGMAAVLGLDEQSVIEICEAAKAAGVICAANFNVAGQTVISGDHDGLAAATRLALERGARKVMPLAVTVANHSPLMAPAARRFAALLDRIPLAPARVPIVANGTARPLSTASAIAAELRGHMTAPVRWSDSVGRMVDEGVATFWEVGPGQVLTGLIKRSGRNAAAAPIGTMPAVIASADAL